MRAPEDALEGYPRDPDMRVRHAVAERAGIEIARHLAADPEDVIREVAQARLAQLEGARDVH